MITNSAALVMILFIILLCLTTSTPSTNPKTANKKPNSLSFKLLHRSSIPLFQDENFQDFLESHKQIFLKTSKFVTANPLFQATATPVYFVKLSIGEPPVEQYLAMDTGSSIVWVDAKRFLHYKPRYSSTYKYLNGSSPECSLNPKFRGHGDTCLFQITYSSHVNSALGYIGLDRFVFSDGYLDNVLFGAATSTTGPMFESPNFGGLLGLGPRPSSLLRSFSRKKFSYCIGDVFKYSSSKLSFLKLGDIEDGDSGDDRMYVPINHDDSYYRIDMDCIEFMETCLSGFNRDIFKYDKSNPYTGVVFDTGAVLTLLADAAYNALADEVARFMISKGFVEPLNKDTQMCYNGQKEEISDFPLVSFHFVDKDVNADLRLRLEEGSLFYNSDRSTFCMTTMKSSSLSIHYKYFTIIGLMAQQNHTILFDLEASRASIHYTSCQS